MMEACYVNDDHNDHKNSYSALPKSSLVARKDSTSSSVDYYDPLPPQPPLVFSLKLHGREQDEDVVLRAYERCSEQSQVVFVSGISGCGKTAFCGSLEGVMRGLPCYLAIESFEKAGQDGVDPALCFALTHLVFQIVEEYQHDLSAIRTAVLETIDLDDFGVVSEFIPNLYQLVEVEEDFISSEDGGIR
jgi:hypothetical protein